MPLGNLHQISTLQRRQKVLVTGNGSLSPRPLTSTLAADASLSSTFFPPVTGLGRLSFWLLTSKVQCRGFSLTNHYGFSFLTLREGLKLTLGAIRISLSPLSYNSFIWKTEARPNH